MKLEKIKQEKYFDILFVGIEEAVQRSQIILVNDDMIKINEEVMFINESISSTRKIMYATLFIGTDMVETEESSFQNMKNIIFNKKEDVNYLLIDYGRKPSAKVLINLKTIKNNMVTLKLNEDTIAVNNIIFTVNKLEFLGDSLFAGKQNSFQVSPDTFTFIKKYLTLDVVEEKK